MTTQPSRHRFEPHAPAGGAAWRERWFQVIFGHQDRPGRLFDVILIAAIVASILITMLDSVQSLHARYGTAFYLAEWTFTLAFTAEYLVRLWVVRRPWRYARSFFGVVDLLSVLPTYISLALAGSQYLLVIRALRILRIFRVLKLTRYVGEADLLWTALIRSRRKVLVFVSTFLTLVLIFGALMYLIEGPRHGFTSIPQSMYWAVITMTTVGFGDITPSTPLGQLLTSFIILIGYSIIVVPTGIFTAELASGLRTAQTLRRCGECGLSGHETDARYCRGCGAMLEDNDDDAPPA
ncbi:MULTISPECIES: ion transporter [Oleiagrimonas]|uniref:Ion transporter n=1 Tax=Oleiagrimonas citrea TaxID=1665687 RepID=A0A846ZR22_9GAMM|nr:MULTISPECIES: ion transporter [Oleiagrimonas]NKZ39978.1 ion transporter [Oleiagrimonas citrea]RAP57003.1 ion transporter [Oleiagrimonas sp. MCCC 1A03011]